MADLSYITDACRLLRAFRRSYKSGDSPALFPSRSGVSRESLPGSLIQARNPPGRSVRLLGSPKKKTEYAENLRLLSSGED